MKKGKSYVLPQSLYKISVVHFFIKHKIIAGLLFLLFLLQIGQFVYFYRQNALLEEKITSTNARIASLKDDLGEAKGVVTSLSQYFERRGNITIAALLETIDRLEGSEREIIESIRVINANAGIMDRNFQQVQNQYAALVDTVEKIRQAVVYLYGR